MLPVVGLTPGECIEKLLWSAQEVRQTDMLESSDGWTGSLRAMPEDSKQRNTHMRLKQMAYVMSRTENAIY
jgi:hypothetical protein